MEEAEKEAEVRGQLREEGVEQEGQSQKCYAEQAFMQTSWTFFFFPDHDEWSWHRGASLCPENCRDRGPVTVPASLSDRDRRGKPKRDRKEEILLHSVQ